ncbi:MAG TPA: tripartite tricarboxylate transporter substrate binding protein, partial [Lysobacter sp.]|nr:tripartite tricarboxylate transporter substrate binding protein [Lysobacter sp.]
VDNKAGANGTIGVAELARSAPDGHTFAIVIAAHAANPSLYAKLPYDTRNDLAAVSLIGVSPLVAAVNKDAPFKNAKELVAYAKLTPGKVSFGSSGNGSAAHLTTELLKSLTQTDMVHIPYKGAAAALQDLMGGQIQLLFDAASGLINPGKAGQVRLIGVAAERRLPTLPDLPTFIEQGIAGFTGSTWAGLLAPARTPPAIIKRVSDEVSRIVRLDDVKSRLEGMGTLPAGSTPEEFAAFIDAETAKWGKVIREAKVKLD